MARTDIDEHGTQPGASATHGEGLSGAEVVQILQEAFRVASAAAQRREVRAARVIGAARNGDATPLEDYEIATLRAQGIEQLIMYGKRAFYEWARETMKLNEGAVEELLQECRLWIRKLADEEAEDTLALAKARYEVLFEKLMRTGQHKDASIVQKQLDRITMIDGASADDVLDGMRDAMKNITKGSADEVRRLAEAQKAEMQSKEKKDQ